MKVVVQSPFSMERAGIVGLVRHAWPQSEVIEAADQNDLSERPDWGTNADLLIVDWRSARIAQELMRSCMHGDHRGPAIVVFCDTPNRATVRSLMTLGAKAVVPLTLVPSVVSALLPFVAAGGTYVPETVLDGDGDGPAVGLAATNGNKITFRPDDPAFSGLTRRQKEVLRHISRGLSNEEIASELGVTLNTVKSHVSSMLRVLGVKRRTQAMRMLSEGAFAH